MLNLLRRKKQQTLVEKLLVRFFETNLTDFDIYRQQVEEGLIKRTFSAFRQIVLVKTNLNKT
jgi:hypothetical protein